MLKALIRVRFASLFSSMFRTKKTETTMSTGKKVLFGILWLYVIAVLLFVFGALFLAFTPMLSTEMSWFYFAFAGLAAFCFSFIGSIFVTQSQLFDATDNELLLSMPIPSYYILLSRMLLLLILNYVYEALIFAPALFVYMVSGYSTITGVLLLLVSYLILPLLTLSLSCLCGWLLAIISSRLRHKNIIQVILMLVFFLAYFYFFQNISDYLSSVLENGAEIAEAIQRTLPPFYYMGDAIANGNLLSFLWFFLFCLVPIIPIYWLLSHFFIRITTTHKGQKKVAYRRKQLRVNTPMRALISRELRFFLSLPMYMMNSLVGVMFAILVPIFLITQRDSLLPLFSLIGPSAADSAGILIAIAMVFCASTNIITAPSISLEGNRLWLLRSLPIPSQKILLAKVALHCIICIPFLLISTLVGCIALHASLLSTLLALLFSSAMTVLIALLGLIINLHMPKFDWINETTCVKQSGSVMLTMFGGMGILVVPVLLYIFVLRFLPLMAYAYLCLLLCIIGCVLAYLYLIRKGVALFENLQS